MRYDSTEDTIRHAERVRELLYEVTDELADRGVLHDGSKLIDPEVSVFDEYTPKLKNSTYGSPEYREFLAGMGEALNHHYAHNRHHPEHFSNGIDGMSLIDILEMLMDWKAATERHDNGDIMRSLELNATRFGICPQLVSILTNTIFELGLAS